MPPQIGQRVEVHFLHHPEVEPGTILSFFPFSRPCVVQLDRQQEPVINVQFYDTMPISVQGSAWQYCVPLRSERTTTVPDEVTNEQAETQQPPTQERAQSLWQQITSSPSFGMLRDLMHRPTSFTIHDTTGSSRIIDTFRTRQRVGDFYITGVETEQTEDGGLEVRFDVSDRDGRSIPDHLREEIEQRMSQELERSARRSIEGSFTFPEDSTATEPSIEAREQRSREYGPRWYEYASANLFSPYVVTTSASSTDTATISWDGGRTVSSTRYGQPAARTPRIERIYLDRSITEEDFLRDFGELTRHIQIEDDEQIEIHTGPQQRGRYYYATVRISRL